MRRTTPLLNRSAQSKLVFLMLLCLVLGQFTQAQVNVRDSILRVPMFTISAAYQVPGGDLSDRFGANGNIGFHFYQKETSNFIWGGGFEFLFGEKVKEDTILNIISTSNEQVIDGFGQYAALSFFERGFKVSAYAGKIIPIFDYNQNSGLMITLGAGFLQHKIEIQNPEQRAPQLNKEYKRGYDRMTNGFCITEFIGYMHLDNKRRVNIYGGFEFTQAFTQNRRSWNFDSRSADTAGRIDLLSGFRLGVVIPMYPKRGRTDIYFYD